MILPAKYVLAFGNCRNGTTRVGRILEHHSVINSFSFFGFLYEIVHYHIHIFTDIFFNLSRLSIIVENIKRRLRSEG